MIEWKNVDGSKYVPSKSAFGFIYRVDASNGRSYIGKKQLHRISRGKKCSSGWEKYVGSSKELIADIASGITYTKTVLLETNSKSEQAYHEARLQFEYAVLLDPARWYNRWISVKVIGRNLKGLQP